MRTKKKKPAGPAGRPRAVRATANETRALRQTNGLLHALGDRLNSLLEDERSRIAREVHDELGQRLTGMKLDLIWLSRQLATPGFAPLRRKLKELSNEVDATVHTVRRIATELRPRILDDFGLVAALEWQAGIFQGRSGVRCSVVHHVGDATYGRDFSTAFFRMYQELMTNVIRHASATRVKATLTEEGGRLVLEVRDNGRGITDADLRSDRSIGLIGMRERAALAGGKIVFSGEPGKGTVARVCVPLHPAGGSGP